MLWQDAYASAEAIAPFVSKEQAAMAKARIALRKGVGVDPLIAGLPDKLQNTATVYARFHWRLRLAGRMLHWSCCSSVVSQQRSWAARGVSVGRKLWYVS